MIFLSLRLLLIAALLFGPNAWFYITLLIVPSTIRLIYVSTSLSPAEAAYWCINPTLARSLREGVGVDELHEALRSSKAMRMIGNFWTAHSAVVCCLVLAGGFIHPGYIFAGLFIGFLGVSYKMRLHVLAAEGMLGSLAQFEGERIYWLLNERFDKE